MTAGCDSSKSRRISALVAGTSPDPYVFESSPESASQDIMCKSFVPLTPLAKLSFTPQLADEKREERVKRRFTEKRVSLPVCGRFEDNSSKIEKVKLRRSAEIRERPISSYKARLPLVSNLVEEERENSTNSPRSRSPNVSPMVSSPDKTPKLGSPKNVGLPRNQSSANLSIVSFISGVQVSTSSAEASGNSPNSSLGVGSSPSVVSQSLKSTPRDTGRNTKSSPVVCLPIVESILVEKFRSARRSAENVTPSPVRKSPQLSEADLNPTNSSLNLPTSKRGWDSEPRGRISSRVVHQPKRWSPEYKTSVSGVKTGGKMISERNIDLSTLTATPPSKFNSNTVAVTPPCSRGVLHNAVAVRAIYGKAALTPLAALSASHHRVELQDTNAVNVSDSSASPKKVSATTPYSKTKLSSTKKSPENRAKLVKSAKKLTTGKKRLWSEVVGSNVEASTVVARQALLSKVVTKKTKVSALKTPKVLVPILCSKLC